MTKPLLQGMLIATLVIIAITLGLHAGRLIADHGASHTAPVIHQRDTV